jgi:CDGSH-type Zn-finger protein/truncated hemoglobin YjbI
MIMNPADIADLREAHVRACRLHALVSRLAAASQPSDDLGAIADRLTASVVRPLAATTAAPDWSASADEPRSVRDDAAWTSTLWWLTVDVTELAVRPGIPAAVGEAAAALQDLVWHISPVDGPDCWPARLTTLEALQIQDGPLIQVVPDGPYLVSNATNMTDWMGQQLATRPQLALCRCGASAIQPLCDGSHVRIGFSSAKDSKRVPDRTDTYEGQQVTILDNRGICQHSGLCTDRLATVFRAEKEPFVAASGGRMDEIIRAVRDCPSGALSYAMDGLEAREQVDHGNQREAGIEVTKDGPFRVTGAIPLVDADGQDVPRNSNSSREHYALCRCGHSLNKPFCSGMHWFVQFHDPQPELDHEPSLYEWCGGLSALTRMTRLFYEKYVPLDPLLAPVFAEMSSDHPQRVAKWLGEVFGGPKSYSQDYGGYERMVSQHEGKGLTEEMRARWVTLLLLSAQEAGLPNDAESRSALGAYLEWGSRLAVENSQPGAHPPHNMPMPSWGWRTAAGPPGGRVSALAPPETAADTPVTLPAASEPVLFATHIKPLFRARDRQAMIFAFDLWRYEDAKANAAAILQRLSAGSMPCDGAWTPEKIAVFQRWVDADMPA